jgi:hypothetical protein
MTTAKKINSKTILALGLGLFVCVGSYNALVINANSSLSGKFTKRLDEVNGHVVPGRQVASWQKVETAEIKPSTTQILAPQLAQDTTASVVNVASSEAAIQEELSLQLVEVTNPKKYPQGSAGKFSGSLATNQGAIESLNVSLPDGQELSISFTEMIGNVFEYELAGEVFSGVIYQVDAGSYLVNLTHGPLEGTRLKFQSGPQAGAEAALEIQQQLADSHQLEIGNFGSEASSAVAELGQEHFSADSQLETQSFIF